MIPSNDSRDFPYCNHCSQSCICLYRWAGRGSLPFASLGWLSARRHRRWTVHAWVRGRCTSRAPTCRNRGHLFDVWRGDAFSVRDLWEARRIALPGAVVQIAVATLLGMGAASMWGWLMGAGLILGLALSIASTVVLLRALEAHGLVDT